MASRQKYLPDEPDFDEEAVEEAEDERSSDGRKRGLYARFDQIHQKQTGPMYGPFDSFQMTRGVLVGKRGEKMTDIAEWRGERWFLCAVKEPGYLSFSVVFS